MFTFLCLLIACSSIVRKENDGNGVSSVFKLLLNCGLPLFIAYDSFLTLVLLHLFFVRFQEWPEEDYPPYANGPGYILSSDIAQFIVSEFEKHKLRVS